MQKHTIEELKQISYSPLDLLPQKNLREKLVDLVIQGVPDGIHPAAKGVLGILRQNLIGTSANDAKVVIFGGGTGLSNILGETPGGLTGWSPLFAVLKRCFPTQDLLFV